MSSIRATGDFIVQYPHSPLCSQLLVVGEGGGRRGRFGGREWNDVCLISVYRSEQVREYGAAMPG